MLWVAEVASTHKGNKALAYEMINRYAEAGADIIKFQLGWTEQVQQQFAHDYNPIRYIDPWAEDLNKWCIQAGVDFMASIWGAEGLEAARSVGMKRYKIAHQLWYKKLPLIDEILVDRKVTFISMSELGGGGLPLHAKLLYTTNQYPTYPVDLHMPREFEEVYKFFGYSDHTHGIEACLLAVARGAQYIEKHVALDKTDLCIKDTPFSASPDEFAQLVRIGNRTVRLLDAGS